MLPTDKRAKFEQLVIRRGDDECWGWKYSQQPSGYSQIRVDGTTQLAHRLSYELHYGPIPPGLHVCHKCDNRECVNPNHLFLGTHADNMRDRDSKGRVRHGQDHPCAILAEQDVVAIRVLAEQGIRQQVIAAKFGVQLNEVSRIVRGERWSRAGGPIQPNRKQYRRKGQEHPGAKLTDGDVREIRRLVAQGVTQREIGRRYGVSRSTIGLIVRGKTWGHVR